MPYALGVDIGTSSLTTATYRIGDRNDPVVTPIHLDPEGTGSTDVVISDDGGVLFGAAVDHEAPLHPERLLRGWSRRVGDTVPIAVGDALIAPESVFAAVVRWAVLAATDQEGAPPSAVCVTHPTGWGEHRVSLLRRALATAGVPDVVVADEVRAVIEQHAAEPGLDDHAIGVYDLGADRMTFSLLERRADREWTPLVSESIEGVGGTRLDDAVLAHVIASSTDAFSHFDTAAVGSMSDMRALRTGCTTAKALLSSHDEVSVPVRLDGAESAVRIELLDLRAAVERTVVSTARVVRDAHRRAERAEAETAMILVGGSSASPQLRARLASELEARIIVDDDPQLTIASGAARIAATHVDWTVPEQEAPVAPSGAKSAMAGVSRAYATAMSTINSAAKSRMLALKRRAKPTSGDDAVPAVIEAQQASAAPSIAESEFDRIISPEREDAADDAASATRVRAAERTEATR